MHVLGESPSVDPNVVSGTKGGIGQRHPSLQPLSL
jgi:hypothetical protein